MRPGAPGWEVQRTGEFHVTIRPSNPDDAFAIARLLAAAGLHPNIGERELNWKYWQARSDRPDPRSFVFVQGTEIVAHAGIVEGIWLGQEGKQRTAHLADWASRSDVAGAGAVLMKYIARSFDAALVAIGGSMETRRILPFLGFAPIGHVTRFALPLRPLRILNAAATARWRRLGRMARAYWWSAQRHARPKGIACVTPVVSGSVGRVLSVLPNAGNGMQLFERSAALLEHALSCPTTPARLFRCQSPSGQQGYFLLTLAPEQARLVDYWTPSSSADDWRSLIYAAIRTAQNYPVAELVTWASDAVSVQACTQSGFRARGALPVQALGLRTTSVLKGLGRIQMLDNDSAFSQHGTAELWL